MYRPYVRMRRSGVPILSRGEINRIGEKAAYDFNPDLFNHPQPLDIDLFAQEYLGAEQDFQFLSNNGIYLGMTVFNDTNRVVIFDPHTRRAEYVHENAKTIIIDKQLLEDRNDHRYRFTMGHECGHLFFHSLYYRKLLERHINSPDITTEQKPAMIQCRKDFDKEELHKSLRQWTEKDVMEWQANAFASAVLMPYSSVLQVFEPSWEHYTDVNYAHTRAVWMTTTFNVSYEAAVLRLKGLGYIERSLLTGNNEEDSTKALIAWFQESEE